MVFGGTLTLQIGLIGYYEKRRQDVGSLYPSHVKIKSVSNKMETDFILTTNLMDYFRLTSAHIVVSLPFGSTGVRTSRN